MASEGDWRDGISPNSLRVLRDCRLEPGLDASTPGYRCQFERVGYFCKDPDSRPGRPVFNRTLPLKDSWQKVQAKGTAC